MNIKSAYDYIQWLFYESDDLEEYAKKAEAFVDYLDCNRKDLGIPDTYTIEVESGVLTFYNDFGYVAQKLKQELLFTNK